MKGKGDTSAVLGQSEVECCSDTLSSPGRLQTSRSADACSTAVDLVHEFYFDDGFNDASVQAGNPALPTMESLLA